MNNISRITATISRLMVASTGSNDLSVEVMKAVALYRADIAARRATTSFDEAIYLAIDLGLCPSDITNAARSAVSKKHELRIRYWKPDVDGSYVDELAIQACISILQKIETKIA